MGTEPLGIGFVGSGFNTKFHIQAFTAVRGAEVRGIWSPNARNAASAAALANQLGVGPARPFRSITAMVADPGIHAIWMCGPNFSRLENIEEVVDTIERGKGDLAGVACEKPLARTVAEAKTVSAMVKRAGLRHGYLENQVFSPQITSGRALIWARGAKLTGRPYLARAAEEHSGPHMPWFWRGRFQGGGVLNDMMCHSAELVRFLLTEPGAARSTLRLKRVTGHIASLKWTRAEYAKRLSRTMGKAVNYRREPSEDFASVMLEFQSSDGHRVMGEATTSWGFVGAGLRLSAELLGPEYSMSWNTLDSGLQLFFSREVRGKSGEDLVEKQNAEMGVMPVVAMEAAVYGYEAEDRHMVEAFRTGKKPLLTFDDGVEVVKILMAAYMSAERGKTLAFPPKGLEKFVPKVAKGTWKP